MLVTLINTITQEVYLMRLKDTKNINIEISIECWKKLKKLSIDKDVSLQEIVRDVLEKTMNKKHFEDTKISE